MKRLLITLVLLMSLAMAFAGITVTRAAGFNVYTDSAASLTAAAIADSTASISDRWYSSKYDGGVLSGKYILIRGVVGTACKATDASTAVNHLTPVIQVSSDGTNFYDLLICSWVNTVSSGTTLAATAAAYAVFTADLTKVQAPYYRIAWMAETSAHAVTINAGYGTIVTTIMAK